MKKKALFCCLLQHQNFDDPIVYHVRAESDARARATVYQHLVDEHGFSEEQAAGFDITCQEVTKENTIED